MRAIPVFTVRTLWEGRWPILALALLLVLTAVFCPVHWALLLPAVLLLFTLSFFRDPTRNIPADPRLILAPADGRIVEIKPAREDQYLQTDTTMVAIFLSVFDVHVQRAPVAGTIKLVRYEKGAFLDVRHPDASARNEYRLIGLEGADGFRVTVRQIAGLIARRIVGWKGEGAAVARGEHLGMIRFGSRVELYLPPGVEIVARVGDYAKGGETIVARRT